MILEGQQKDESGREHIWMNAKETWLEQVRMTSRGPANKRSMNEEKEKYGVEIQELVNQISGREEKRDSRLTS